VLLLLFLFFSVTEFFVLTVVEAEVVGLVGFVVEAENQFIVHRFGLEIFFPQIRSKSANFLTGQVEIGSGGYVVGSLDDIDLHNIIGVEDGKGAHAGFQNSFSLVASFKAGGRGDLKAVVGNFRTSPGIFHFARTVEETFQSFGITLSRKIITDESKYD